MSHTKSRAGELADVQFATVAPRLFPTRAVPAAPWGIEAVDFREW
ncbi:MAG: hypothetical protein AAF299_05255 [Pseudomonadota bacterium]